MAHELTVSVEMNADRLMSIKGAHDRSATPSTETSPLGAGYRPMDLLLLSLAECAAYDLFAFLQRLDARPELLEVRVRATQREEHPRVLTHIHLEFLLHSSAIDTEMAARAIDQTRTYYCPIWTMLEQGVPIETSVQLLAAAPPVAALR